MIRTETKIKMMMTRMISKEVEMKMTTMRMRIRKMVLERMGIKIKKRRKKVHRLEIKSYPPSPSLKDSLQHSSSLPHSLAKSLAYLAQLITLLALFILLPAQDLVDDLILTMPFNKRPINQESKKSKFLNLQHNRESLWWKMKTLKSTWNLKSSFSLQELFAKIQLPKQNLTKYPQKVKSFWPNCMRTIKNSKDGKLTPVIQWVPIWLHIQDRMDLVQQMDFTEVDKNFREKNTKKVCLTLTKETRK